MAAIALFFLLSSDDPRIARAAANSADVGVNSRRSTNIPSFFGAMSNVRELGRRSKLKRRSKLGPTNCG